MFFFKRKKVTVDCFINNPVIYELFKIDQAHKFAPKEWKQLPPTVDVKALQDPGSKETIPVPTSKRCIGIVNQFTTGFILPNWTDFKIEMKNDGLFYKHNPMNDLDASPHPKFMYWKELYSDFQHVKLSSPWLIQEKTGVNFSWQQCTYHNTERHANYHALSAIIDFKAQRNSHVNMFIRKGSTVEFKAGEPLIQLLPLTERNVELKCHLVDNQEYTRLSSFYASKSMWFGQHRELYNQKSESKCPFGFK